MGWDPGQYLKFSEERLRPALDLLARVPAPEPKRVVDLGCGTGATVPVLRARWPDATVVGVDSSPEMLAKARSEHAHTEFVEADIATWRPIDPSDVVFSNAALHWLDDHETLFPSLLEGVRPGGWLAVQMPRNFAAPSHECVVETIDQGPWRAQLEPHLRRRPVREPAYYARLLRSRTQALDVWETEYLHVLHGEDPVADFVRGSWLKQFLDRLVEPARSAFEADYRARVRRAYPAEPDGSTHFPFRRLFLVARRSTRHATATKPRPTA
jgi:trans-aconitate 2-methyltransferase